MHIKRDFQKYIRTDEYNCSNYIEVNVFYIIVLDTPLLLVTELDITRQIKVYVAYSVTLPWALDMPLQFIYSMAFFYTQIPT